MLGPGKFHVVALFHTREFKITMTATATGNVAKAKFRRRTSHEPNRMQMRKILCSPSFAFNSSHVKYGV